MSIEDARSWTGSAPHVTKRLCVTIVFFIGVICVCAGFLLGRMSRNELKRGNEVLIFNLTAAADNLYKKAKRIPPKAVHHNNSEKITASLLEIFRCSQTECGKIQRLNLAGFVRNCINNDVNKLLKKIYNASVYLDSLR